MKKKRYLLTTSFFIYADDTAQAIGQSQNIVRRAREDNDNYAEIDSLYTAPFASLERKKVL